MLIAAPRFLRIRSRFRHPSRETASAAAAARTNLDQRSALDVGDLIRMRSYALSAERLLFPRPPQPLARIEFILGMCCGAVCDSSRAQFIGLRAPETIDRITLISRFVFSANSEESGD